MTAAVTWVPVVTVRWRDLPEPMALVPSDGTCESCGLADVAGLVDPSTDLLICTPCILEAVRDGALAEIVSVTR